MNTPQKRAADDPQVSPTNSPPFLKKSKTDDTLTSDDGWSRPGVLPFDPSTQPIIFQQMECDYYLGTPVAGFPSNDTGGSVAIIRFYGVTQEGHSVLCYVHGFCPYFYVTAPPKFEEKYLEAFKSDLNKQVEIQSGAKEVKKFITDIKMEKKESILFYHNNKKADFLRITTALPKLVPTTRRIFETGFEFHPLGTIASTTFESNIEFVLRYMIDRGITGASWVEAPPGKYAVRKTKTSSCQIEIDIGWEDIIPYSIDGEWSKIGPLRILSFDIECAGRKGHFPEPEHDPVIQIANMITIQGEPKPRIKNVFTLNTCSHISGAEVLSFKTEQEMLKAWKDFIVKSDPDILTGYNITNFDIPYLFNRAAHLKVDDFAYMGRINGVKSYVADSRFSSKAYGTRDTKLLYCDGRLQFDVLQIIQRDHKLRSYTLNAVSAHFLGEQKEDVPHSIITDLQNGTPDTRRRLAIYCLKDAYLPQRLLEKLMCLVNYIEMARVTGVPFEYLLSRGQQIKVVSQLYRKSMEKGLLIPTSKPEGGDDQYEGATVIEPKKGYYQKPIATLDFSSLYPSIMMAHNLCYTTLINADAIKRYNLKDDEYIKTPSGDYFVKEKVRKGILPEILEHLLQARSKAKNDLKKETDPFKRAVLDGRQLALKLSANSVYGFTGASVGKLPCIEISQSVTSFGRQMIEKTKKLVEEHYTVANGYKYDSTVIYGDTDSVMIQFGNDDLREVLALGKEASEYVSKEFIKPIKLEFEKVYYPYLLINKKRYAGLYWTNPNSYDKLDAKGIETVRRDNCRLVKVVIDTCLRKILIDKKVDEAIQYVKQTISDLLQNKVDMSQLVISKSLSKSGEDYKGKQAHVELAEKMKKRDISTAPGLGDRVPYVVVKGLKGAAAYEKSEDPIYVLENNLPIDSKYYLDNQLSKPLLRIFEPILGDKANTLLSGDHTRTISLSAPSTGGLMKFAKKIETCLGCKAKLENDEKTLCKSCKCNESDIFQKHLSLTNELEQKFSRLWSQCQRCQGSLTNEVLCTSRDCPIFYMRTKVKKDLQEASNNLEKFDLTW